MLSRGRCRFGRFDLSKVPANRRGAALALQLSEWAPFDDADHVAVWSPEGRASVWCWDRAALAAAWSAASPAALPPVLPESLLRPPPAGAALRVLRALDGCEAQAWGEGGELLASRWWPAAPSPDEARLFLRDAGFAAGDVPAGWPQPQDLPLADAPWGRPARAGQAPGGGSAAEAAVFALLAISVLVPAAWLATDHLRLHRAQALVDADIERESQRSREILDARSAALGAVDEARAIVNLAPYPSPLQLMSVLAAELPAPGVSSLREWEQTEGRLRILVGVATGEVSGAEHVRALERSGLFDDIKIVTQSDPKLMGFVMTLRTRAALAAGPAPAASAASTPAR